MKLSDTQKNWGEEKKEGLAAQKDDEDEPVKACTVPPEHAVLIPWAPSARADFITPAAERCALIP